MISRLFRLTLVAALVLSCFAGCRSSTRTGRGGKSGSAAIAREWREESALRKLARAHAHFAAGVVADLGERSDEAASEFAQAAELDPLNEELILDVTARLVRLKRAETALQVARPAASAPGASVDMLTRAAFLCAQLEKYDEAIQFNQRALKLQPDSFVALQSLYVNLLQAKQPDRALAALDEGAKLAKADAGFLLGVAELYNMYALQFPTQREAVNAKALALLSRIDRSRLRTPEERLKLADRFYSAGDPKRAAALYQASATEFENSPQISDSIRRRLTEIYLETKDRARATEQLEALLKENPGNALAYYSLGKLAYEDRDWTNAVLQLQKAIAFGPRIEQAHYDLAAAQLALDRTDDALGTLAAARKIFRANFVNEYLEGMAHSQKKDYAQAVKHFTAAEVIANAGESDRLNHVFYFQIAAACERNGDREQAVAYFEKCLKLQPDYAEALNYLGYMWAERGENLERAREMISRALKAEPNNAAFLDSMGWVLFKLNQPSAALPYLLQAVKSDDAPDATVYDHLGDVYSSLNQQGKAREAWEKSISLEPSDAVKKKLGEGGGK